MLDEFVLHFFSNGSKCWNYNVLVHHCIVKFHDVFQNHSWNEFKGNSWDIFFEANGKKNNRRAMVQATPRFNPYYSTFFTPIYNHRGRENSPKSGNSPFKYGRNKISLDNLQFFGKDFQL